MCQRPFAEVASQIYLKEKSHVHSAYYYSRIRSIERNLKSFRQNVCSKFRNTGRTNSFRFGRENMSLKMRKKVSQQQLVINSGNKIPFPKSFCISLHRYDLGHTEDNILSIFFLRLSSSALVILTKPYLFNECPYFLPWV